MAIPNSIETLQVETAWATFASLSPTHAAVALLAFSSRERHLQRGDVLVAEADEGADVFLVGAGHLRTGRLVEDGQEVWLADVGPGELIGELAALTGHRRTSTVAAASEVQVFAIDRTVFLSVAAKHGEVAIALARLLARRLVRTSDHITDLFGRTVIYRVHRELIRLGTPSKVPGELVRLSAPPTVTELTLSVHATRESTSRAMTDLEERGVVIRKHGVWIVRSLPDS